MWKGVKIEHDGYNFPKAYVRGNSDASGEGVTTEKHMYYYGLFFGSMNFAQAEAIVYDVLQEYACHLRFYLGSD